MRRLALTLTLLCTVASALAAVAPPYPARPVRMLLPQPPGGTMETVGRAVSQLVSQAWGQSIVIDNRSGANGIIAGELTVRALPDGYTLLYTSASLANNQLVHIKPSFDALKDLAPVTVHSPQMAHMLTAGGHVAVGSTPAEFKTFPTQYFTDTAEQMRIAKVMPE
jgi:tripartite-type tricarboxylate transporter receptor subunit TctC